MNIVSGILGFIYFKKTSKYKNIAIMSNSMQPLFSRGDMVIYDKNIAKLKDVQNNYAFHLGFDNYLEYVEIVINCNYYDRRKIDNIFEML